MKVSGFRFRVAGLAAAALTAVFGCVATDPSLSANAVEKVEVMPGSLEPCSPMSTSPSEKYLSEPDTAE